MSREISQLYEFDAFRLDPTERRLLHAGALVPLTPKAFDTLVVLVERSGHLVEKDELMRLVWVEAYVEEANLARCIHTLRKALGEEQGGKRFIETVPKRGYRFVAEVRAGANGSANVTLSGTVETERQGCSDSVTEAVEPETMPDKEAAANDSAPAFHVRHIPTSALATPRHRVHASFFIVPLALALAAVGAYLSSTRSQQGESNKAPINSIAVLPFVNVSTDPNLDYFSDGISESLIDRLSQLPQLNVIARTSSFKYKGESIEAQAVATKLGVQALVMGRVVQRGDNLTIRVELVDARENRQLWSDQYNRRAADALTIQQEIVQTVSHQLRLKLSEAQEQQLAKRTMVNPQAYELLLRGRSARSKGGRESLRQSTEYFKQAVDVDPSYALAYSELSFNYNLLLSFNYNLFSVNDRKEVALKAKAMAQKSLELDERLPEAHFMLAGIRQSAGDWREAENEYQRAIELNPNHARAHSLYSGYLSVMGRHAQAIAEAKRAKELDPLSPRMNLNYGGAFFLARQYEQAIEIYKKTLELNQNFGPTHSSFALAYLEKGMYAEAIAKFQEKLRLAGDSSTTQIYLGAAYARAGKREKALEILKRLQRSKEYVSPGELPVLYVALGQHEKAFVSLEQAYVEHDLQLQNLGSDPSFDPIRSDPRFQDLMRRVGLPK